MGASATYLLKRINGQRDAVRQARLILKFTQKTAESPEVIAFLTQLLNSEVPVIRFAAARILAPTLGDEAPDSAYERLRQIVVDPTTTMPGYRELDPPLRELVSEACIGLACFDRRKRETVDLLVSILDRRSDSRSVSADAAHLLLALFFKKRLGQTQCVPEELTSEQRDIITKILVSRRPWTEGKDLERSLDTFGLPKTKEGLVAFLARLEALFKGGLQP